MWNISGFMPNMVGADISRVAWSDLLVKIGVMVARSISDLKA